MCNVTVRRSKTSSSCLSCLFWSCSAASCSDRDKMVDTSAQEQQVTRFAKAKLGNSTLTHATAPSSCSAPMASLIFKAVGPVLCGTKRLLAVLPAPVQLRQTLLPQHPQHRPRSPPTTPNSPSTPAAACPHGTTTQGEHSQRGCTTAALSSCTVHHYVF